MQVIILFILDVFTASVIVGGLFIASKIRCLTGKRQMRDGEIISDETREITCPANHEGAGTDTSCLKVSMTTGNLAGDLS